MSRTSVVRSASFSTWSISAAKIRLSLVCSLSIRSPDLPRKGWDRLSQWYGTDAQLACRLCLTFPQTAPLMHSVPTTHAHASPASRRPQGPVTPEKLEVWKCRCLKWPKVEVRETES